jgi:hypothetical protein
LPNEALPIARPSTVPKAKPARQVFTPILKSVDVYKNQVSFSMLHGGCSAFVF